MLLPRMPRTDAVQWMASLSLLWDHAWMHRWINAFLSFAGWCAVRIKAHASQGKRWQKSWPTKSWGGGRRRICPGRLAAFLPLPFSGDSLLNGPLLPFFVFWFKLLLPDLFSLSLVHLPGHFWWWLLKPQTRRRRRRHGRWRLNGQTGQSFSSSFSFFAKSVIEHYSVSKEPQAQLVNHHHHCCFSFVFGT